MINTVRRGLLLACAFLFACAPLGQEPAAPLDASGLTELKWLRADADALTHLTEAVPEPLAGLGANGRGSYAVELGRVAFRSPGLLGGVAAREGLSCQTCHTNGRINHTFFLADLSSEPGTVDTTTAVFSKVLGDGIFNPIPIPTLEDVKNTGPYGHDGREPSLEGFVRTVIVDEFNGRPPAPDIFSAVIAYVGALELSDAPPAQPVTFDSDLNDLLRSAEILEQSLSQSDGEAAEFVVFAIRNQLGRMAERFPGASLTSAREHLAAWSLGLTQTRDLAREQRFAQAQSSLADWRRDVRSDSRAVRRAAKRSLYDRDTLRIALGQKN